MKIKIEIGGKERTLRFDWYAMEEMNKCPAKGSLSNLVKMIFGGLASACNVQGIDNDFTLEECVDIVDELALTDDGKEKLEQINKCLEKSQAFVSLVQKAQELTEEEKKSPLIGTGSTPLRLEKSA